MRPVPALVFSLALLAPVAALAAAADPAARIRSYNDGVVAIMKAGLPAEARAQRFETLVRDHYDMAGIAALVVGPKWQAASAADKQAAVTALTRHSAVQLAKNFTSFDGERFLTDSEIATRGTSSIVKVTIQSKSGSNLLQYRLRQAGSDWRIIDVVSDGVSNLALQRAELAGTIASDGIAGMARKLAAKDRI